VDGSAREIRPPHRQTTKKTIENDGEALLAVGLAVAAFAASYVIYGKIRPRFSREQILMNL
jgi:hypothetical protein